MELTGSDARDLMGAYVLDALTDQERRAFERCLADDSELATATADLLETASLLGAAEADAPPATLAERTFAAAFARRAPGTVALPAEDPVTAYRGQTAELVALLGNLRPDDWRAVTVTGWTVHELVAHLLAIDGYMAATLTIAPPASQAPFVVPEGTANDHHAMTEPTVAAHADEPPMQTATAWAALVDAIGSHLDDLPESALAERYDFHGLDLSLQSLLGTRAFEVWTHTEDIRRATSLPLAAPKTERLRFMSNLAVRALPLGLLLAGIDDPGRTVRIVLTGEGGGEWLQPLSVGAEPGPVDATLVADVVDFCRLASQRLTPADLHHQVEGDVDAVRDVLLGAQVFAA